MKRKKGIRIRIRVIRVVGVPMIVINGKHYFYLKQVIGAVLFVFSTVSGYLLFKEEWWVGIKMGGIVLRVIVCLIFLFSINFLFPDP